MNSLGYYVSALKEQKDELIDTLNKKGLHSSSKDPFDALVDRTDLLGYSDAKPLSFVSSRETIIMHLAGSGTVKVYGNQKFISEIYLQEVKTTVEIDNPLTNEECIYYLDILDGISEIDLHGNSITSLAINDKNDIEKLVVYDNQLLQLDCSNCSGLQFLHIHGNPLCDDAEEIKATISSLVDRTNAPTGSVIFYPWYGLETLIEESSGSYYKYPHLSGNIGNYSNEDSMHYSWVYNSDGSYKFEEDRLYGVVSLNTGADNRDEIKQYRVYKDGKLLSEEETDNLSSYRKINFYQKLRKNVLESISLKKNWMFGSAIMYNESEWDKCPWDFRQNNVADMWETAEKGFGYTIGTSDSITLMFPGAQFLNVVGFKSLWGAPPDYTSVDYPGIDNFLSGGQTHGDYILSILCGNGSSADYGHSSRISKNVDGNTRSYKGALEGIRYGYAPLAKLFLMDHLPATVDGVGYYADAQRNSFVTLIESGLCDTITSSTGEVDYPEKTEKALFYDLRNFRKVFQEYADKNVFTVPAGNEGGGFPYTEDCKADYDSFYGTNNPEFLEQDELSCRVFYVQALDRMKNTACFSRSSPHCTRSKLSAIDFLTQYGVSIHMKGNQSIGNDVYYMDHSGNGTSFSTPMACAVLLLLRSIYSKFEDADKSSFGKFSPFMDYVREHWIDRVDNQMDFSVGYGMPYILAEPSQNKFISSDDSSASKKGSVLRADIGECVQIGNGNVYSIRVPDISNTDMASKSNIQLGVIDSSLNVVDHSVYKVSPVLFTECFHNKDILPITPTLSFNTESERVNYVGSNYDVFKLNLNGVEAPTEYTVSFLVDVKPSTLLDIEIDGTDIQKITVEPFFLFLEGSEFIGAMKGNKWSYSPSIDKFDSASQVRYQFYRSTQGLSGFSGGNEPIITKFQNLLEKYTKVVFTLTVNNDGFIHTYLNGKCISCMKMGDFNDFTASGIAINKTCLVDNSSAYIYGYNRVLSEEEIVKNTAAILKIGDNL